MGNSLHRPVVLIVDDEPQVRALLKLLLRDRYVVLTARDGDEALRAVRARPVDMVLLDVNLPGRDGIKTLERIRAFDPEVGVLMISAEDSAGRAVEALKKGAYDYITKPFEETDLLATLKRYTDTMRLRSEVAFLREGLNERTGCSEIISASPKMARVFEHIRKVAATSSNVLITGESGTGKELVARAIHRMSMRAKKPFVPINCGAVPSELMESEIFGHEKGAFTGAHARKIGKFEYADGGTLFLDEVSTLPMHLQIKLLRVLQEKSFERVGSNVSIRVDVRIVAASNVDLEGEVRKGRFREDLYYRLKVVPIELPPLRERVEDIGLLVQHFMDLQAARCNKAIKGISAGALSALASYRWPGNVRELENLVERLVVLARDGALITCDDLPAGMFRFREDGEAREVAAGEPGSFKEASMNFERDYIIGILNKTNWNRNLAASMMKIHRNTLLSKMKQLGIRAPRKC
ncbi:MAG: sigma-54-dependent transcriptional regulator [Thermodesulfobacteriota bacterium]